MRTGAEMDKVNTLLRGRKPLPARECCDPFSQPIDDRTLVGRYHCSTCKLPWSWTRRTGWVPAAAIADTDRGDLW